MHIVYATNSPRFLEFSLAEKRESIPEAATVLAICDGDCTVENQDEVFFNAITDEEYFTLRQTITQAEQLERAREQSRKVSTQSPLLRFFSYLLKLTSGEKRTAIETIAHGGQWQITKNNDEEKKIMSFRIKSGASRYKQLSRTIRLLFVLIACLFALSLTAQAATFQVTTAADNGDNVNPTPGSLRQAIISANNTPGTDTITFSIGLGAQTIAPLSSLPIITDPAIIDGTTQPGFNGTPIIELKGTSAGAGSVGLQINAGGSTVRGLVINRFSTGVFMATNGNNVIVGNYIGTDITGIVDLGNSSYGINVQGGNNNTIGGTTTADRNIISGNGNTGLRLSGSSSNTVFGNYIGVDATGTADLGNDNQGLRAENSSNDKIGGASQGEGNVISGNADVGVLLVSAFGNTITGNRIGIDVTGTAKIGNDGGGIVVLSSINNAISSNSIAFNGTLGIDLDADGSFPLDGVTANDANDGDTGPNNLQNYPVITNVNRLANATEIQGTLNSTANTQFRLEFFANAQCDPTGYGEGQTYIGTTNVTTVGNDTTFDVTLPVVVPATQFVTATATDPAGNTSEFSLCAGGVLPGTLQFSAAAYGVNENGGQATITVTRTGGSSGAVSVKYSTVGGGTATAAVDYTTITGLLNWADGDSSNRTITVAITDDTLNEAAETINLALSNPTGGATLGTPSGATLTINDNDPQPSLSISDVSVTEGNSGTTNATFNVTLSAASGQTVTVKAAASGGTATEGQDFQSLSTTLTFTPGQTSKPVTVLVNGDTDVEPDELFSVFLTSPVNATIADNQGVGTIPNDDVAQPASTVQFEHASYSVGEDVHYQLINVTRTGDTSQAATVDYATSDGTAQQRTDYNLLVGTLSFAPGETSKTLTLLITEDSYVEGAETLNLNLSNAVGVTLGAQSQAQVTILDNDNDPNAANAIVDAANFVRQQYHDFLNREPDPPGFQGWQNILNTCPQSGKDVNGNYCDRIEVSSAFYRSQEFHDRGYFTYRFYETALGRIPKYQEFMHDVQKVSGFLNAQQQEDAKVQFISEFMARTEFKQKYDGSVDAAAYVDALSQTAGVTLSSRNQIVQQLQANQITRGQALRMVIESAEVDQKFYDEGFVIMQYFGYLRRDADILYLTWIQTLKQTKDYRVLVNGFLNSSEYVLRFGK
jgi:Calx-beta domain/Domain of unknown function (DUF4214)